MRGRTAAEIYGEVPSPVVRIPFARIPVMFVGSDACDRGQGPRPGQTYHLTKGVVLRRKIGEVRAVDGVSFELEQGRTLGIVGESGSGKSTTLHEILELKAPQSGSIEVLGSDVATLDGPRRRALRRNLQVVFQDRWHPWIPASRCSIC